ncbi:MAG: hypothetical protein E7313_00300 [Clostridiales bacterium]|nr:hypothetical protein [Clostridiales bacterium]
MNNKEELKKQVIVLSLVLVFVIIVAIVLNTKDSNKSENNIHNGSVETEVTNNINNTNKENLNEDEIIKQNLKGLLEEPDEDYYINQELNEKNETVVTTKNGETIIIKD